jgi:hypothetical protein
MIRPAVFAQRSEDDVNVIGHDAECEKIVLASVSFVQRFGDKASDLWVPKPGRSRLGSMQSVIPRRKRALQLQVFLALPLLGLIEVTQCMMALLGFPRQAFPNKPSH